jgi:HSP20 family protein
MLLEPFATLDRELGRLESLLPDPSVGTGGAPMDVRREPDRYVVEMELPGVDPSTIDITLTDGWLSVKADRSSTRETDDDGWVVRERRHTAVVRGFSVDETVDIDAITADYTNGVLTLTLPRTEEAKPRKVAVKVTSGQAPALGAADDRAQDATRRGGAEETSDKGKAQPRTR